MTSSQTQNSSWQRTTEEVFYDHLEKRKKGLAEEDIAENYDSEVVQLTRMGPIVVMRVFAKATAFSRSPCRVRGSNITIFSSTANWFSSSGGDFLTAVKLTREPIHLLSATAALLLRRSITKSTKLRRGINSPKFFCSVLRCLLPRSSP